jgi:hypothetical protein
MNDAAHERCPLADERNGGVDRYAIESGAGELILFQGRQAAPDLEQDVLIQIVLVRRIPGIDAADSENSVSILIYQFEERVFVCRRRIQSRAFV